LIFSIYSSVRPIVGIKNFLGLPQDFWFPFQHCGHWRAGKCCTPSGWWRSASRVLFVGRRTTLLAKRRNNPICSSLGKTLFKKFLENLSICVTQSDVDVQSHEIFVVNQKSW